MNKYTHLAIAMVVLGVTSASLVFHSPGGVVLGIKEIIENRSELRQLEQVQIALSEEKIQLEGMLQRKKEEVGIYKSESYKVHALKEGLMGEITEENRWKFDIPSILIQLDQKASESGVDLKIHYDQLVSGDPNVVDQVDLSQPPIPDESNSVLTSTDSANVSPVEQEPGSDVTVPDPPVPEDTGVENTNGLLRIEKSIVPVSVSGSFPKVTKYLKLLEGLHYIDIDGVALQQGEGLEVSFQVHVWSLNY